MFFIIIIVPIMISKLIRQTMQCSFQKTLLFYCSNYTNKPYESTEYLLRQFPFIKPLPQNYYENIMQDNQNSKNLINTILMISILNRNLAIYKDYFNEEYLQEQTPKTIFAPTVTSWRQQLEAIKSTQKQRTKFHIEEGKQIYNQLMKQTIKTFLDNLLTNSLQSSSVPSTVYQNAILKLIFFMDFEDVETKTQLLRLKQAWIKQKIDNKSLGIQGLILYIGILIKMGERQYLPYVQQFHHMINSQNSQKIPAILLLFSIPKYEEYFPVKILDQCLVILKQNISQLKTVQFSQLFSNLFQYGSESDFKAKSIALKKFIQQIARMLASKKLPQWRNVHFVFKTVKICSKIGIDKQILYPLIAERPQNYKVILYREAGNRQIFLPLLLQQRKLGRESSSMSNNKLIQQFRQEFERSILQQFEHYDQAEQIESNNVTRSLKLILKYFVNFGNNAQFKLSEIIKNLISKYDHPELLYYAAIFLCLQQNVRVKSNNNTKQKGLFIYSNAVEDAFVGIWKKVSINQLVTICYQIQRKSLFTKKKSAKPKLFTNENIETIKQTSLDNLFQPVEIGYFFYLLAKQDSLSSESKKQYVNAIKNCTMKKLSEGKISSLKTIYTILHILYLLNYEDDKYFWINIEKGIELALKNSIKNSKNGIELKDLKFLKKQMCEAGHGSMKFKDFVYNSIKDYEKYSKYQQQYLEKAEKHQMHRRNYRMQKQSNEYSDIQK